MYELENAQAARRRKIVNVIMWVVLPVHHGADQCVQGEHGY